MKKTFSSKYLLAALALIAVLAGCGGEAEKTDTGKMADSSFTQQPLLTVEDTIEYVLNDAMGRLRYGDKSALYENEFSYLTDTTTLDAYLATGQMKTARRADTVLYVDVNSVSLYDHDSAWVEVTVHMVDSTNTTKQRDSHVVVYYHRGRWIKPTISVIKQQVLYDQMIHQAESSAAAEAEYDY